MTIALLLLTSGLPLMPTGPLLADDGASTVSGCNDRLIYLERRLEMATLIARKEPQLRQWIDRAYPRPVGDAERWDDLADQLDRMLTIF